MKKNLFAALILGAFLYEAGYADPPSANVAAVQPPLRNAPPGRNVPGIGAPGNSRSVFAGQIKLPNANDRHLGSGNPAIGGPATPGKALPALTGVVNPAKTTAAVNGSDMKRKP
ncbi:MAG: hypothetical protein ABSE16_01125 [Verrucomicrobiota bacterium]|jgi:hypothetical protein